MEIEDCLSPKRSASLSDLLDFMRSVEGASQKTRQSSVLQKILASKVSDGALWTMSQGAVHQYESHLSGRVHYLLEKISHEPRQRFLKLPWRILHWEVTMAQSVLKSAASLFAEREPAEEAKKERWEWGGCYSGFRVDGTIPERASLKRRRRSSGDGTSMSRMSLAAGGPRARARCQSFQPWVFDEHSATKEDEKALILQVLSSFDWRIWLVVFIVGSVVLQHKGPQSPRTTRYIQSKVNPILENLVTEVLLERPDNPVPFMVRWLAERSKTGKESLYSLGVGEAEKLRNEIKELQEPGTDEIKVLSDKVGEAKAKGAETTPEAPEAAVSGEATEKPPPAQEALAAEEAEAEEAQEEKEEKEEKEEEDSDEDEDDFGDEDDDWKPPTAYMKKGQRGSVSAEAYGAFNEKKAFEPPVYEKSTEQESRIKDVLSKSFLFNALSTYDLKVILDAFLEKKIPAGERIIQEGDDGDVMFLIESGAFDCIKKIDGSDKVVKKCGQGDVFGELALLYNCPRAASVEATEEAVVWQLDRETFSHIVRDASAKRREAFQDFLTLGQVVVMVGSTVPLFKTLESYDLMQLADCLQQEGLEAGQKIINQGDPGDTFYIVEEGELVATKKRADGSNEEVLDYKRGDFFGELALIKNEPRAATVEAKTASKICKIDRKSFKNILGQLEPQFKEAAAKYKP
eukprot:g23285.t1